MAKHEENYVDPEMGELVPVELPHWEKDIIERATLDNLDSFTNEDGVIELADLHRALGLPIGHLIPDEINGRKMDILRLELRISETPKGPNEFFLCQVRFVGEADTYTVSIGGALALPKLKAYQRSGASSPLRCTLNKHMGGQFGKYWTLD